MTVSRLWRTLETLLIAILVAATCCTVTALVVTPTAPSPIEDSQPVLSSAQNPSVMEALSRLEVRMSGLSLRREPTAIQGAPFREASLAHDLEQILCRLEALDRQLAEASRKPMELARDPVERDTPMNQGQVAALCDERRRDYGTAKKSVELLTLPEVVQRFGRPSKVSSHNGKLRAVFYCKNAAGRNTSYVALDFTDGYVSHLESNTIGPQ